MSQTGHITQPSSRTTLDAIEAILRSGNVERIDVAVAYVTTGGAYDLVKRAVSTLGNSWDAIPKRWLTSFDYCRTEPTALDYLLSVPNSSIRIHDAEFCVGHNGAPRVPFHPKAFLIRTDQRHFVLAGSGNMSRSGLSRGIEAGFFVSVSRNVPDEPTATEALARMRTWFNRAWNDAANLVPDWLPNYRNIFEHRENLIAPTPTEDDVAATYSGHGALSAKDLQRLRLCEHFWIYAGNVTRNRGPGVPGNQLMMKRLSRVFFGFSPEVIPENSHIGDVSIRFNGGAIGMFSLTYSDNKMDKLVLPIPGSGGPISYDKMYLLFRRTGPRTFDLTLGNKTLKSQWAKRSASIGGAFQMSSGREWGVF